MDTLQAFDMVHTGLVLKSSSKSSRDRGIVWIPIRSKKKPRTVRELQSEDGVITGRLFAEAKWSELTPPRIDTSVGVSQRDTHEGKLGPIAGRGALC